VEGVPREVVAREAAGAGGGDGSQADRTLNDDIPAEVAAVLGLVEEGDAAAEALVAAAEHEGRHAAGAVGQTVAAAAGEEARRASRSRVGRVGVVPTVAEDALRRRALLTGRTVWNYSAASVAIGRDCGGQEEGSAGAGPGEGGEGGQAGVAVRGVGADVAADPTGDSAAVRQDEVPTFGGEADDRRRSSRGVAALVAAGHAVGVVGTAAHASQITGVQQLGRRAHACGAGDYQAAGAGGTGGRGGTAGAHWHAGYADTSYQ
jgi:hypothetical protein